MIWVVVRRKPLGDDQAVQVWVMAQYGSLWEAERACKMFRDAHPTKMVGEATFTVELLQKYYCQQAVGG